MDCKQTRLKRTNKRWRGSEGTFMTDREFENSIKNKALIKLKERLNYEDLENMSFGKISKFFYKLIGIKEEDFHKLAEYINSEDLYQDILNENYIDYSSPTKNFKTSLFGRFFKSKKDYGKQELKKRQSKHNISDDELQKQLKEKEEQERYIQRDKEKTKHIENIDKNTKFIIKIYGLLKTNFKDLNKSLKKLNKNISDIDSSGLADILMALGAAIGGGILGKILRRNDGKPDRSKTGGKNENRKYNEKEKPRYTEEYQEKNRPTNKKLPPKTEQHPKPLPEEEKRP
jgi:hypothetical protein